MRVLHFKKCLSFIQLCLLFAVFGCANPIPSSVKNGATLRGESQNRGAGCPANQTTIASNSGLVGKWEKSGVDTSETLFLNGDGTYCWQVSSLYYDAIDELGTYSSSNGQLGFALDRRHSPNSDRADYSWSYQVDYKLLHALRRNGSTESYDRNHN